MCVTHRMPSYVLCVPCSLCLQREFALKHLPDYPMFKLVSNLYDVVPKVLAATGKVRHSDMHTHVAPSHWLPSFAPMLRDGPVLYHRAPLLASRRRGVRVCTRASLSPSGEEPLAQR